MAILDGISGPSIRGLTSLGNNFQTAIQNARTEQALAQRNYQDSSGGPVSSPTTALPNTSMITANNISVSVNVSEPMRKRLNLSFTSVPASKLHPAHFALQWSPDYVQSIFVNGLEKQFQPLTSDVFSKIYEEEGTPGNISNTLSAVHNRVSLATNTIDVYSIDNPARIVLGDNSQQYSHTTAITITEGQFFLLVKVDSQTENGKKNTEWIVLNPGLERSLPNGFSEIDYNPQVNTSGTIVFRNPDALVNPTTGELEVSYISLYNKPNYQNMLETIGVSEGKLSDGSLQFYDKQHQPVSSSFVFTKLKEKQQAAVSLVKDFLRPEDFESYCGNDKLPEKLLAFKSLNPDAYFFLFGFSIPTREEYLKAINEPKTSSSERCSD
jgi:hypothetical protein